MTYIITRKITIGKLQAISSWGMLVLIIGLLSGCGATPESSPTPPAPIASPTPSATPAQLPTATLAPSVTPTWSPTPEPGVKVVLVIQDCITAFCVPSELERNVRRADGRPGILSVEMVGEYHVGLGYDPNELTQEEAVKTFESATGFEAEVTE